MERALRLSSLVLLAFCLWAVIGAPAHRRTDAPALSRAALGTWTTISPAALRLHFASAPDEMQRDWLAALGAAGTRVTWTGPVGPTAMEVLPSSDPSGGRSVLVAGAHGEMARLFDTLGVLDSATMGGAGATFRIQDGEGWLRAAAGTAAARSEPGDSIVARHVALLGHADWESRFVIAALEERGWIVDARLDVAPGITVTQGRALPLDTARQAVVVVLDSLSSTDAAAVARFIGSGGGVVVGPMAARTLGVVVAGGVGERVAPEVLSFAAATPKRALALWPILPRADAVVLETSGHRASVAARRFGAGRVVQVGYEDTWRWRMAGVGDAVEEHREWWSRIVAAAAYRPEIGNRRSAMGNDDRAPLAALVRALGPASSAPAVATGYDPRGLLPIAGSLLFLFLLGEWASRRLRGAS